MRNVGLCVEKIETYFFSGQHQQVRKNLPISAKLHGSDADDPVLRHARGLHGEGERRGRSERDHRSR